jgi:hypothetical protein
MSTAFRVTIAAVVLLAAAAGAWFLVESRGPGSTSQDAVGLAATAPESDEPLTAADLERADDADSRAEILAGPEVPAATAAAAPAADAPTRIDGRFVDASGRGIAGVRVAKPASRDGRAVESDDQGAFVVEIAPGAYLGRQSLEAHADGWASHFSYVTPEAGATFHRGEIVLLPGGTIAGQVVDADGLPVANARVLASTAGLDGEVSNLRRTGPAKQWSVPETKSLADGTFRLGGVPTGLARAWATGAEKRWTFSELIDVPARGAVEGVVLELEPLADDDRIEGVVLDPDGEPVPRATVGFSYRAVDQSGSSSVMTGENGRFRLVLMRKVPHDLHCSPGEKDWTSAALEDVAPGTLDVVLQMRAARLVDLVALDEKGAPVASFAYAVRSAEGDVDFWDGKDEPRAGGTARFKVPSSRFVVDAWARGRERVTLGPLDPAAMPAQLACTLAPLPGLRGRVLHGEDPVAGAKLSLHRMVPADERYDHNGYPSRIQGAVVERDVSDAQGRFQVTVREAGQYALLCDAGSYALAEVSPIDVDPRAGREVDVFVGAGGTIEGRVLAPTGRDAAGVIVGLTRFDCRARTVRVGADGRYRFDKLTPGPWSVRRATQELSPNSVTTSSGHTTTPVTFDADCVVEEGRVTRFDLDLREAFDAVLVGHVTVNGAPATGWTVVAKSAGEAAAFALAPPSAVVDARGDVRLALARPATYQIELVPVAEDATTLRMTRDVAVHAGENRWDVDLDCGALEGTVGGDRDRRSLSCMSVAGGGWACSGSIPFDALGRFRVAFLPAGPARVTLGAWSAEGEWRTVSEQQAEIARGGVARVQLP